MIAVATIHHFKSEHSFLGVNITMKESVFEEEQ